MALQTPIPFTDEEKTLMAKVAFRQAQLGGRGDDIPEHELEDAKFYVNAAITIIKARNSYDPQTYARDAAQNVIIEYVRLMLLGGQPFTNANFLLAYDAWLKSAAQERYANRPDSWPQHPGIRQRTRNHTYRTFDPDAQDEADF